MPSRTLLTFAALAVVLLAGSTWLVVRLNPSAAPTATRTTQDVETLRAGLDAASQYLTAGRFDEAQKIVEALHERYPADPLVLQTFSELRLHQGRTEDAYKLLRRLVEIEETAEARGAAGLLAASLGRNDESIIHYERACALDPSNPQYPLYVANVYRRVHENVRAQECLLRVIAIDPTVHLAWGGLAQIAFVENQLDMAEQHLARARKLEPDFLTWRILEARVLRRRGRPEEAITLLTALGPHERYQQEAVDEVAKSWALLGSPTKAAEEHVRHLNHDPNAWRSAVAAARYYHIADDERNARQWLRYAQRVQPEADEVKQLAKQFER